MAIDLIAIVLSVLAFAFSLAQYFADTSRKKRLDTLNEYYVMQDDVFAPLVDFERRNRERIKDPNFWSDDNLDDPTKTALTNYLSKIERFSVGIKLNIFDYDTLRDCSQGHFETVFELLRPRIEVKRKRADSSGKQYKEFENLYNRLKSSEK